MNKSASGKDCLIIGEGVEITGKVDVPGLLEVHGKIVGEVRASKIEVGPSGRIEGRIVAEELELRGYASDSVSVSRRLAVRSTATLVGAISYRNIEIESGASIRGKLEQQGVASEPALVPSEAVHTPDAPESDSPDRPDVADQDQK
jgi:cytoskeletal protein CcmA (bactofilin family)